VPQGRGQLVDGSTQPAGAAPDGPGHGAAGVTQHRGGVAGGADGQLVNSPVTSSTTACAWSPDCAWRSRSRELICRARRLTARLRSRNRVRPAAPAALIRATRRLILVTAWASRPESVGRSTLADTTVVSARTFPTRSSFASCTLASSASLSACTA
jgi:hypothetical protein